MVHASLSVTQNDPDLAKRILLFLHGQNRPGLKHLAVEVHGDTAVIEGRVATFYERQLGVECCKRVAGVRKVIDLIKVAEPRDGDGGDKVASESFGSALAQKRAHTGPRVTPTVADSRTVPGVATVAAT